MQILVTSCIVLLIFVSISVSVTTRALVADLDEVTLVAKTVSTKFNVHLNSNWTHMKRQVRNDDWLESSLLISVSENLLFTPTSINSLEGAKEAEASP